MFDQLKDLYNLKKQAEELQKQMANEQITGTSRDGKFTVTLNGNQELINLEIAPDANLLAEEIKKSVKEAHKDAQDKLKSVLAQKFKGMI
jgi:DNA-binding protein YbaB